MNSWQDAPRFGARQDLPIIVRPSVYAFIVNGHGLLAVVRAPDGTFLPGGGVEPGETVEGALVREVLEECGLMIHVGAVVTRAIQYAPSEREQSLHEKQSVFCDATVIGERPAAIEPGHQTLWLTPAAASDHLSHESHAWAIQVWGSRKA